MTFLYTARARFSNQDDEYGSWSMFINWSRLEHLTELVSLDTGLNEQLVEYDTKSDEDWKDIVAADTGHYTECFRTLDFVLKKMVAKQRFNLLTVVIEPESDCSLIQLANYDFLGYDLIDYYYDTSALSNCGGFDESFLPKDLNNFGLIDDYEKAKTIQHRLLENNPDEDHADTNIMAIWRHRTIGW